MRQAAESKPGAGEWPRISAADVREIIPDIDRVAEEMTEAIQRGVPEYARPLNDTCRASVHHAVTHAVQLGQHGTGRGRDRLQPPAGAIPGLGEGPWGSKVAGRVDTDRGAGRRCGT